MARLAEETIKRIKSEVSLVRLTQSQGYSLQRHGKHYSLNCPFHEDKTASLVINPSENLFQCFGCGIAGSVIDWVMKTQGLSFRFACELLQKDLRVITEAGTQQVQKNTTAKLASPLTADADHQTAIQQVCDFYHQSLKESPEALAYLESRGLKHAELIETFHIGYANRTLGYHLPAKNRKAGAELRGKLQDIGLLRDSGHEHFNGSIVVPIVDDKGQITEIYGRKILGNRLRKGTAQHLYLPGPHAGVWNAAGLCNAKEVILCEAILDAMSFWVHGFKHVTASYGTSGFTQSHLTVFKQAGVERVLIAYDRDEAGDRAAEKLAQHLQAEGIGSYRIVFPKNMDANEYAVKMSPGQKALALVIRKAQWLGAGQPPADPKKIDASATVQPELPQSTVALNRTDQGFFIVLGDRSYRIRGLENNAGYEQLKIQLMVQRGDTLHMDKLDLYSAKQRQIFINQACVELGEKDDLLKKDLVQILLALEAQQQQLTTPEPLSLVDIPPEEERQAKAFLQDPNLLARLLADFERAGIVGEETNKLVGYLACVSRKLEKPLAVMIQSSSAAGKSSLMESILALMPEEERVQYSAMTGQSLFYMGEKNLKHKILAIAEEEGASNASYGLKLLQSEGEVSIASTTKDDNGNLVTKEYRAEGPVMLFFTTTAIDNDEELVNRCLVLSVNEDSTQTADIHTAQRGRRTVEGRQVALQKKNILTLHQNAQRLLKPVIVVNPYAMDLTFPTHKVRLRRDNEKYLNLIDAITLLHQYQRPHKVCQVDGEPMEYIEVTLEDIALANRLASEVLGKSLDELPQQTRKLLTQMTEWVTAYCQKNKIKQQDYRFSRRQVRALCGWSEKQVRVHLGRLVEMEYLLVHGGRRGQSFEYELIYQGEGSSGDQFLSGLIDVDVLKSKIAAQKNPMLSV